MAVEPTFLTSLLAGGIAGLSVDITLFPLDTLKTRLQCQDGFLKAGGFRHLYRGIGAVAIGSAPNSALFFCVYDSVKKYSTPFTSEQYKPVMHMLAASAGELASCFIKVPVEVVKQRQQASPQHLSSGYIIRQAVQAEGLLGMFRGFRSTVLREIPFSVIQLPIWELLMKQMRSVQERELNPLEVALCGAVAGAVSAAVTTPLDVAKTRIMLSEVGTSRGKELNISTMLRTIYKEGGVRGLFAGFVPRVVWITVGGGVFFGVYGAAKDFFTAVQTS